MINFKYEINQEVLFVIDGNKKHSGIIKSIEITSKKQIIYKIYSKTGYMYEVYEDNIITILF